VLKGREPVTGLGRNLVGPMLAKFQRERDASYRVLDAVVRGTGGTVRRTSQATAALSDVIADFRSSYVLRYTPRSVAPAGWHELQVRVTQPGSFTVRARKGYEGG
jgi:hypothetical protein